MRIRSPFILLPITATIFAFGAAPAQAPALPSGITVDWGEAESRRPWTAATFRAVEELGASLWRAGFVPRGISAYCPAYATQSATNRKLFWVGLLSRLARFESSFNPELTYVEPFPDSTGNRVISRGLLQISIESANGSRYRCGITQANQLHDPATNLSCGVRIMAAWVPRDGWITGGSRGAWRGAARYWSPFRKADRRRQIAAWTSRQPYCRRGA